jgi:hypothetical protein
MDVVEQQSAEEDAEIRTESFSMLQYGGSSARGPTSVHTQDYDG